VLPSECIWKSVTNFLWGSSSISGVLGSISSDEKLIYLRNWTDSELKMSRFAGLYRYSIFCTNDPTFWSSPQNFSGGKRLFGSAALLATMHGNKLPATSSWGCGVTELLRSAGNTRYETRKVMGPGYKQLDWISGTCTLHCRYNGNLPYVSNTSSHETGQVS
jgi:hypothetical protein